MSEKDMEYFNKASDLIHRIDDYIDEIEDMDLPNVQKINIMYELKLFRIKATCVDSLKKVEKIEKKLNQILTKLQHHKTKK